MREEIRAGRSLVGVLEMRVGLTIGRTTLGATIAIGPPAGRLN